MSKLLKKCMCFGDCQKDKTRPPAGCLPLQAPPAKFTICLNCGFKVRKSSTAPTDCQTSAFGAGCALVQKGSIGLPAEIGPMLLLDYSPTPQILMSEYNKILYANKSATSLLSRAIVGGGGEPDDVPVSPVSPESPPIPQSKNGLEGLLLDRLPIELVRADMRKWISLEQVLESVKNALKKKYELAGMGYDANAYDEFYAEGQKTDDYYGDADFYEEKKDHPKEVIPVVITKSDGELVNAYIYVSLVASADKHVALSIVPNTSELDASFQVHPRRRDGRGMVRSKDIAKTGRAGEDVIDRAAKLKDLILDEMQFAFICLTPDGDIAISNKAVQDMLGVETFKASVGEGFEWISRLDIWRADFSERLPFNEWALNKIISEKKPVQQTVGLYVNGEKIVVDLKGTPLWENPETKDELLAALTVVVDQTVRENREREISRSEELKKAFLMNLCRGLKAPVAGIIAILELLHETGLNDEQEGLVHQVFGGVNALLLVMNDLIDFNKIDNGDLIIEPHVFVLQDLVADIKTLFTQSMAKEGIDFIVDASEITQSDFGDGTRLLLTADEGKIRRIVINILSNAFKFTCKGWVRMRVSTHKVQRGSLELRFEIKDTGVGIPKDHIKRLFLPFKEMVEGDISTGHFGSGFGLSIAKSFATLLQGTISCTSTLDSGTTFHLIIPCERPLPSSKVTVPRRTDTLSGMLGIVLRTKDLVVPPPTASQRVQISGANVLIVEDNWTHQVVTRKRLERMGCKVEVAVNGQNAISMMRRGIPVDVVFMDLQMPLLDGFETTAIIRAAEDPLLEGYKRVPIVAVTATEMAGDRDRAKEAGMNDFTLKPVDNDRMKVLLEKFLAAGSAGGGFVEEEDDAGVTFSPRGSW